MRTVYIAGPMRGIKYYNFPAFDMAESDLTAKGYNVINPADLDRLTGFDAMDLPADYDWDSIPEGFSFDDCVTRDLKAVRECDIIYMLHGWEESKGAQAELALAEWLGKEVRYQDDEIFHRLIYGQNDAESIFPTDSKARLEYPVFKGLLDYFPNACAAVAHHSFVGNEQHNAGEPMHWAKEKSIGTGDQIVRHLMEGELEACAWRALELLERKLTGLAPFGERK